VGDCSEGIEASGGNGSRKAHHVTISPQEDRGGAEETVGAGTGGAEEGGLEPAEPITRIVPHSCSSENCRQLCCLSSMPQIEACGLFAVLGTASPSK